jgi:hypothetical protein
VSESSNVSPERLAALLDGRLDAVEAAAVRSELASSDDDTISAYADALAVASELSGAANVGVPSVGTTVVNVRRRWRWGGVGLSLAAAAVLVALVMPQFKRGEGARADLQQQISAYVRALPPGAELQASPWAATRGAAGSVSDRGRAVRLGVLLVDLDLRAADPASRARVAASIADLLSDIPGGASAAMAFRDGVAGATATVPSLVDARRQAVALVDSTFVGVGAWLECARIAAVAGRTGYVDRYPAALALAPLASVGDSGVDAAAVARLSRPGPRDLGAIRGDVELLLHRLAQ